MTQRVGQVVYTATQFPSVTSVRFAIDGQPLTVLGGEGLELDKLGTREALEATDATPIILLESPAPFDVLSSPFTLSGTSNTFEATYLYRLTNSAGAVITEGFGTATCGTGCRGVFSQPVSFSGATGPATLRVFDRSAKDGSEIDIVEIPVTLP
jgi:hypothetical protein